MKKKLQFKNGLKAIFLLGFSCCVMLVACKKTDGPTEVPTIKNAKFSADVNGTSATGTEFLEDSYITTNDEFLAIPYAEIHIAGSNSMLDLMIASPTVKQYNVGNTSSEAGIVIQVNGTIYEATNTSVLNVTEATGSKIAGTISGTFKNVATGATVTVSNGNFSAQF
jgi:hypothetical protein